MKLILLPDCSQTYDIKRVGAKVSVGRKQGCDIMLSDIVVSGCHCYITVNGPNSASVEDVSTNGTYINGVKVGKALKLDIKEGDILTFGKPHAGGPPGVNQGGCVNFKVSFEGQNMVDEMPRGGAVDSVMWRQEVEDLKVLVSQTDHRSQMAERKSQELQFKLSSVEADFKKTKEDNVELLVRNESMRKEIDELRSRLQIADRTAFEADKRAETLQYRVDSMTKEFAEIAALKASLNLKHTTLSEEVDRLRRENAELSSRTTLSADVKRRLMGNLQQVQQIIGGTMGMVEDIGTLGDAGRRPVLAYGATRGYPLTSEPSIETTPADKFFIGSAMTAPINDNAGDSMFPSRLNTANLN